MVYLPTIYHKYQQIVGKYTSPMDPMGWIQWYNAIISLTNTCPVYGTMCFGHHDPTMSSLASMVGADVHFLLKEFVFLGEQTR